MVLSSTYSTPPPRYSRDVLEKLADLVDQLATVVHEFCSSTAVLETISHELPFQTATTTCHATNFTNIDTTSKQHPAQNEQLSSLVTGMPETELKNTKVLSSLPPPPTHSLQTLPSNISLPIFRLAKLTEKKSSDELSPLKSSPLIMYLATFTDDKLATFRCTETFQHGHHCPPPKFVFLESEHEPLWKPFTVHYGYLGLEGKAVFQDGSIDTC